ncbi:NADH dehydrogenase subunit 5 (mitochondrion) [Bemisia tabaci]|uniref:NADH:ubiquinone reductase (H(+)-translocating) n=1 Tax=Bemisia tabaci TaxID=7038 RepID=Q674Q7_BEMTA|nr:NADH dehydrogenase subunit 5 [Bemisia tabaci]AAU14197.1 NADH dehydrogenase subunit 5 [Bemisia tabaci]
MIKNYTLFMILASIMLVPVNMMIFSKSLTIMIEWKMMSMKSSEVSMFFLLDESSSAFVLTVMMVTTSILMYSSFYIEKKKKMFAKILVTFMISMLMMILSPNMMSLVMSWEGLGMTSFVLIMYYQNKKSVMSSFYTMMMNRVGDITLLLTMMILMDSASWMFLSTEYLNHSMVWISFLSISTFSKSAQMPFSSWLTEAMAAPTPVSALVHSSTLVTAGVYLTIRFKSSMLSTGMNPIILTVAMMTLMMASLNSLMEMDMKKLVALSTLSQISIMFISISANLYSLAFFHMIVHATFKALIFLCSSTFIYVSNTQDLRKLSSTSSYMMVTNISFNVASMILCALPFVSSFYSKEIIMEMMMISSINSPLTLIFITLMMVTSSYSLKMMMIINLNKMSLNMKMKKETYNQKMSKVLLLIPSMLLGNKLSWLMELNMNIVYLSITEKLIAPVMILTMMKMMKVDKSFKINKPNTSVKQMMSYMWFMKNLNLMTKMNFMNQGVVMLKTNEKGAMTNQVKTLIKFIYLATKLMFKIGKMNLKATTLLMFILMIILI